MKARTKPLIAALATLAVAVASALLPEPAEARGRGGHGHHGHGHRGGYWGPGFWGVGFGAIGYGYGYGYGGYAPYGAYPYYGRYYVHPQVAPRAEYVVVDPTQGDQVVGTSQPVPLVSRPVDPIFYPKGGQSAERIESDRQECNRWATTQPGALNDASIFQRATFACMEGRGYTVK